MSGRVKILKKSNGDDNESLADRENRDTISSEVKRQAELDKIKRELLTLADRVEKLKAA